jgi:hypothetical protein
MEYQIGSSFTSSMAKALLWHLSIKIVSTKVNQPPSISFYLLLVRNAQIIKVRLWDRLSGDMLAVLWVQWNPLQTRFVWILAVEFIVLRGLFWPSFAAHILQDGNQPYRWWFLRRYWFQQYQLSFKISMNVFYGLWLSERQ